MALLYKPLKWRRNKSFLLNKPQQMNMSVYRLKRSDKGKGRGLEMMDSGRCQRTRRRSLLRKQLLDFPYQAAHTSLPLYEAWLCLNIVQGERRTASSSWKVIFRSTERVPETIGVRRYLYVHSWGWKAYWDSRKRSLKFVLPEMLTSLAFQFWVLLWLLRHPRICFYSQLQSLNAEGKNQLQ